MFNQDVVVLPGAAGEAGAAPVPVSPWVQWQRGVPAQRDWRAGVVLVTGKQSATRFQQKSVVWGLTIVLFQIQDFSLSDN